MSRVPVHRLEGDDARGAVPAPDARTSLYHEVRSPLGLIITAAHAAAAATEDGAVRRRLDAIVRVAERTLRVAAEVIEGARAGTTTPAPPDVLFHPATVVEQFVLDLRAMNVEVEWRRDGHVDECFAHGRASQFEALLHTLFEDALDHRAGDSPIRVHATLVHDGAASELRVGIANRVAPESEPGYGIGEHLRQRSASRLGGALTVERVGDDYQVMFTLPVQRASRRPSAAPATPAKPARARSAASGGSRQKAAAGRRASRAGGADWEGGAAC